MEAAPGQPPWLKKVYAQTDGVQRVQRLLQDLALSTVCLAADCPNLGECYARCTATFLIMGSTCTRRCRFCAIEAGDVAPLDPTEPRRVARAVRRLGLKHAVITSVTRDDLPDGGAAHFAETIRAVRALAPGTTVEVLIPDLQGAAGPLARVLDARPDVVNHNVETVPRLYGLARPGADFQRSLDLLRAVRDRAPALMTRSGIMLGLGESWDEVVGVLGRLVEAGCQGVTIGQYLQPSPRHLPVWRYVAPGEFDRLAGVARGMGFLSVSAGPFVRSSYNAAQDVARLGEAIRATMPRTAPRTV